MSHKAATKIPARTASVFLVIALVSLSISAAGCQPGKTTSPIPRTPAARAASSTTASATAQPATFDADRAMADLKAIEGFGVRKAGSAQERAAAKYVVSQLRALGLSPRTESFPLLNGKKSQNVIAEIKGTSDRVVILGAHLDSKAPSPGANDNASGCATLLELARVLATTHPTPTIQLVWFGSEEDSDSSSRWGSRWRLKKMSSSERAAVAGMVSVDGVGAGETLEVRTMDGANHPLADLFLAQAKAMELPYEYLRDQNPTGQSDHGFFEMAGIPAVLIVWLPIDVVHSARDTSALVRVSRLKQTGDLVLAVLDRLDTQTLDTLQTSNRSGK